jgi:hypothetical protein
MILICADDEVLAKAHQSMRLLNEVVELSCFLLFITARSSNSNLTIVLIFDSLQLSPAYSHAGQSTVSKVLELFEILMAYRFRGQP